MPTPHPIAPPGTKRRADLAYLDRAVRDAVRAANRDGGERLITVKIRPDGTESGSGRILVDTYSRD
ncbi:MAG: hypothetical protein AAFP15_20090 [Bacteroidota bacterium]